MIVRMLRERRSGRSLPSSPNPFLFFSSFISPLSSPLSPFFHTLCSLAHNLPLPPIHQLCSFSYVSYSSLPLLLRSFWTVPTSFSCSSSASTFPMLLPPSPPPSTPFAQSTLDTHAASSHVALRPRHVAPPAPRRGRPRLQPVARRHHVAFCSLVCVQGGCINKGIESQTDVER